MLTFRGVVLQHHEMIPYGKVKTLYMLEVLIGQDSMITIVTSRISGLFWDPSQAKTNSLATSPWFFVLSQLLPDKNLRKCAPNETKTLIAKQRLFMAERKQITHQAGVRNTPQPNTWWGSYQTHGEDRTKLTPPNTKRLGDFFRCLRTEATKTLH